MNMFKSTTAASPEAYIALLEEPAKSDIEKLHILIQKTVPDLTPYIISGMIGYGTYHYTYASGREGDWCIIALAKQKNYISLYACGTEGSTYVPELYKDKLPGANVGKSCIRFKKLSDVDEKILIEIIKRTAAIYNT